MCTYILLTQLTLVYLDALHPTNGLFMCFHFHLPYRREKSKQRERLNFSIGNRRDLLSLPFAAGHCTAIL